MTDRTVVYYTSNREAPAFEAKIQAALVRTCGDVPIVSVSQQPITLGTNICVGEVGHSVHNAWRQLQIGAEHATTPYICAAESDYLYPPDYFTFRPPSDAIFYCPWPMYVLFAQTHRSGVFGLKPIGQEGAIVVGREFLLRRLATIYAGLPQWKDRPPGTREPKRLQLCQTITSARFPTATATVNFKTDANLHQVTRYKRPLVNALPGWGSGEALLREYCA